MSQPPIARFSMSTQRLICLALGFAMGLTAAYLAWLIREWARGAIPL